jgi:hypothetical protein
MTDEEIATPDPAVDNTEPIAAWFGVGLAVFAGGIARIIPILGTDFPLNDGGLFAIMIGDLVDDRLLLPASTTYNGLDIPFGYPPLAFYVAAIANQAFGIAILDTLRFLPLLFSLATIIAVYWLAQGILATRSGGVLAALGFALLPRAYLWMITGGGITRGLGFLFAIVALGIAWRLLRSPEHKWWTAIMLGLVGGLTVLAHPQAGVFMAVSILIFLPWAHGWRPAAVRVLVAGLIGLVVVSPWMLSVLGRHGLDPFLSALGSGGGAAEGILMLLSFRFTELPVFDVIAIGAIVGAVVALRRRELMLPIWLIAIWIVDSRAGSTFSMVPMAMLAAYLLLWLRSDWLPAAGTRPLAFIRRHPWWAFGVPALLIALVTANYLSVLRTASPTHALSREQRAAMEWTAEHAGADAVFAVVSGSPAWANDAVSEWFPALTRRQSAGTVQGYEWLGAAEWERQVTAYEDLQECAVDVLPCVVVWSDTHGRPVTHVFLPKGRLQGTLSPRDCCPAPRHSVELVPGARVIYDGPGATVIQLP